MTFSQKGVIPAKAGRPKGGGVSEASEHIHYLHWMPPYQVRGRLLKSGMTNELNL